ncbi:M20/M25/M40 family metallo-hydrolase [Mycoplasma sp. P36-A1]|uniref:M20/M25/M40 family metallo-hydrolase n=1 Tax=Mycoplasma sp. P36-A1 TaxID=3252900 RepID=UPI003C2D3776
MINTKRLVDNFLSYIQIDSESGNEKEMCDYLAKQLMELGFEVIIDNAGEKIGSNGYNVFAKMAGDSSKKPLLLSAHLDTVTPGNGIKPIIDGDLIHTDGSTILGGDDKAGAAIIVECMQTIVENNLSSRPVEAVFSIFEEGGLKGAKNFDTTQLTAQEGVVIDSGGPIGTIITKAPAQDAFKVLIHGKPAHAGLAPEEGISAIQIAAKALENMNLYRIDEETTANFGYICGGGATNIITDLVELRGETRSLSIPKLEKQTDSMIKALEDAAIALGGTTDIEVTRNYDPLVIDESSNIVVELQKAFKANNLEPLLKSTGGGSDTNVYYAGGINCVNISCGMDKVHTTEEKISILDMENTAKSLFTLLTQ